MNDEPSVPLDDLARVLAGYGMPAPEVDEVLLAVAAAEDAEAVAALLQARPPSRAAWLAPIDGYLRRTESGYLLTEEADTPLTGYAPWGKPEPLPGSGAVREWSGEREAWRLGELAGRTLRVPVGGRVACGEPLTDGVLAPHDLLHILGRRAAETAAAERLAALCALDPQTAGQVVRPLFEAVEIIETADPALADWGAPRLRRGALCTRQRFSVEHGRAIGSALRDLPPSADPRLKALADIPDDAERAATFFEQKLYQPAKEAGTSIDSCSGRPLHRGCSELAFLLDQGGAIPARTRYDLGAFDVSNGTLQVADPDRPDGPVVALPARAGTWRALSFVMDPDRGRPPRIAELRVWADGHSARFGEYPDEEFPVASHAGLAGCFDPVGSRPTPVAAVGPSCAAVVDGHGVVVDGTAWDVARYRASVWRDDTGVAVALSLGNATQNAREEVEALDGGELWERAVELDIQGRNWMDVDQLRDALEHAADGRNPGPVGSG